MGHGQVTKLLRAHSAGDSEALDRLLPIVYDELRRVAAGRMHSERPDHTLSATALVHEAFLELVNLDRIDWQSRSHFFAIASRVMRNVLVDYAMRRGAQKRGGGESPVRLGQDDVPAPVNLNDVIAVHDALSRLAYLDERQVRVVECRVFGGLTVQETADALNISPATVGRDWSMARAWLNRELSG